MSTLWSMSVEDGREESGGWKDIFRLWAGQVANRGEREKGDPSRMAHGKKGAISQTDLAVVLAELKFEGTFLGYSLRGQLSVPERIRGVQGEFWRSERWSPSGKGGIGKSWRGSSPKAPKPKLYESGKREGKEWTVLLGVSRGRKERKMAPRGGSTGIFSGKGIKQKKFKG